MKNLAVSYGMKRRSMNMNSGRVLDMASKYEADKESDGQRMLPVEDAPMSEEALGEAADYELSKETVPSMLGRRNIAKEIMSRSKGNQIMPIDHDMAADDFLSDEGDDQWMGSDHMPEDEYREVDGMDSKGKQRSLLHRIMGNLHSTHIVGRK